MTFECGRLEEALDEDEADAIAAARAHAEGCAECRERLAAWEAVSATAPLLRKEWESPNLRPSIDRALAAERARHRTRARILRFVPLTAIAATLLAAATWLALRRPPLADVDPERRLLTEGALDDVERTEAQYTASIDRLATLAETRIAEPSTPLLASYREKLQILDAAIAECRAHIQRNRFNAQLRRELLSIYQEKQRTLEQLMGEST
jgi:hypothetical protein